MPEAPPLPKEPPEKGITAVLVLEDGTVFWGYGIGATGAAVGEVCFNTSMTGYQEIMTDPSYAGQIITFTFPHIGNVGANFEDMEAVNAAARRLVIRQTITEPSNFRAVSHLDAWLSSHNLVGISGVDTRRLTRHIRMGGPPRGVVCHSPDGRFDIPALYEQASAWPGLEGMDLARDVTCQQTYDWSETRWSLETGYGKQDKPACHVVAVDYGMKNNIARSLATEGAKVTVVPATASAEDILRHKPDGIFLS
ncbi:MAG: carbamoyl-phosphate synthase domain-containing protein, partial [Alphaproteobacteria bacterium]|nr:carbamoyl-phosphate synthase domain-containing protein [Alphaproteobacteria bacterium]